MKLDLQAILWLIWSRDDPSAVPVGGADNHSREKWFDHTEVKTSFTSPSPSHMT